MGHQMRAVHGRFWKFSKYVKGVRQELKRMIGDIYTTKLRYLHQSNKEKKSGLMKFKVGVISVK
jgi:hypothetical protein